ncbi:MAG: isoprenylcysteine carboxylmethyltransferase family protein [Candidatus Margulisiibacteriota bacterium]|nr:isoprenylcysteine carboxylmethyltransferase family protein [Candidatus Margulisiibacteriota bacterium]
MQIQLLLLGAYLILSAILWYSFLSGKLRWTFRLGPLVSLLPILTVFPPQPRFELDFFWWRIAGYITIALGVGIYLWAIREYKTVLKDGDKLIDTGPFQFVRHPMYLGIIFIYVGWWWIWAAVYAFYLGMFILAGMWLQAYIEEKIVLERSFGDQYREYRKITGMFWIK